MTSTSARWPSAALLLVGLALAGAAGPPTYRPYHNARYGYHIDYPAALVRPQPEADNGDGRKFVSADGLTTLTVYASHNALENSLSQEMKSYQETWRKQGGTLTLSQQLSTGFVLSGHLGPAIFYQKTLLRNGIFSTFSWQYPATSKAAMDGVITHTSQSFQPSIDG